MGRSGKTWAIEHSGVVADLITAGKSLSNGLPISVTMGRREILDSWGPGAHCTTFCGYPVACAGGIKVVEIMQRDRMPEQASAKGELLVAGLTDLMDRHPLVGHFDCKGLYAGVELVRDRKTKEPAKEETAFVCAASLKKGLIFISSGYHSNRLGFAPPLVISAEEMRAGLAVLDQALGEAEKKFRIGK
jgi:4-aminobutyrate aminotransferase-like enzyme